LAKPGFTRKKRCNVLKNGVNGTKKILDFLETADGNFHGRAGKTGGE
jgi:hypothetical protein